MTNFKEMKKNEAKLAKLAAELAAEREENKFAGWGVSFSPLMDDHFFGMPSIDGPQKGRQANAYLAGLKACGDYLAGFEFGEGAEDFIRTFHNFCFFNGSKEGGNVSPEPIETLLARGQATMPLNSEGGREAMAFWSFLANQRGEEVPLPKNFGSNAEILNWAKEVLTSSAQEEGSMAPRAVARPMDDGDDAIVHLEWEGTFTPGRKVWIRLMEGRVPGETNLTIGWDSGTGAPSTFFGIEKILKEEGISSMGTDCTREDDESWFSTT